MKRKFKLFIILIFALCRIVKYSIIGIFRNIFDEYLKQKAIKEATKLHKETKRKYFVLKIKKRYIVASNLAVKNVLTRSKKDFRYIDKHCVFSIDSNTINYL